jgi:hypothetical protein
LYFVLLCGKILGAMITRYLEEEIQKDLDEKMVFLSGPRPSLYQIHMDGEDDVLACRVRMMPASKFLAPLP